MDALEAPIHLTCMSLDCGRKPGWTLRFDLRACEATVLLHHHATPHEMLLKSNWPIKKKKPINYKLKQTVKQDTLLYSLCFCVTTKIFPSHYIWSDFSKEASVNRWQRVRDLGTWRKSNSTECDCITWESELILVYKHLSVTLMGLDKVHAMHLYSNQFK